MLRHSRRRMRENECDYTDDRVRIKVCGGGL